MYFYKYLYRYSGILFRCFCRSISKYLLHKRQMYLSFCILGLKIHVSQHLYSEILLEYLCPAPIWQEGSWPCILIISDVIWGNIGFYPKKTSNPRYGPYGLALLGSEKGAYRWII
uniref:Uncharacterized protein n=1 Tax=Ixodes ricinus TaxID=34613 RepID=A0A147BBI3_IXORI